MSVRIKVRDDMCLELRCCMDVRDDMCLELHCLYGCRYMVICF